MSDNYGLVLLPASAGDSPVGDPALAKLGTFLASVINSQCEAAWLAAQPAPGVGETPLVSTVALLDPTQRGFNTQMLPALFIWRSDGTFEQTAVKWRTETDHIQVIWMPPALPQEEQRNRDTFWPLVAKCIDAALERARDVSWLDAGDTDSKALSYPAVVNSIMTSTPTSLSPQTYSGAQLNGSIGTTTMSPRRELTITTAPAVGAYNTSAPIVVTWTNWHGVTVSQSLPVTLPNGGETIRLGEDVVGAVSYAVPAQLLTTGAFQFGTSAVVGRGSQLLDRCMFERCDLLKWNVVAIKVDQDHPSLDGDQLANFRLPYLGIQMTIAVRELLQRDLTNLPKADPANVGGPGVSLTITKSDGSTTETAQFPDHGVS